MIQSISATTTGDDIVAQPPSSSSSEITATPREVHQWLSDLNMTQYEDRFHVGDVENFREKLKSSSSIPFGHRARLLSNVGKLPSYHSLSTPPQPPTPVTPSSSSVYLPRPPSRAETWLIPPHQLQLQTRIDSNQCCCRCSFLYRGNWLGKDVVIRIYHNVKMSSQCMELLSRIARIRHPNIALFMAAAFSKADEKLFIVTESVTHGSIEQYGNPPIGKRTTNERLKTLTSQNILHISKGIAVACAYLRCQGFSHKNLKPSNVLIDSSLEVKVTDYYIMEFNNLFHPLPCEKNFAVAYLSPEALRRTPFIPYGIDSVSDIHSFGMILWELVAGRKPYCGLSRAHIRILVGYGGYRESRPNSHALHGLSRLIRKCTYQDPSQRMTFEQLLISLDTMNRTANSAAEDALITFISGR
jgi:serine/threonine protein kinase